MRKARDICNVRKELSRYSIPKFYKDLGKVAMQEYVKMRYFYKASTRHWHYDYDGLRYWFWEEVKLQYDKEILEHLKNKGMIFPYELWLLSFNKPEKH